MEHTKTGQPTTRLPNVSRALAIASLALVVGACSFTFGFGDNVEGSGNVISREFEFSPVDAVSVSDVFDVTIVIGDVQRIVVRADDNLFDHLKIKNDRGTLELGTKNGSSIGDATLEAEVTVTELADVDVSGVSDVAVRGVAGGDLTIDVSGVSNIDIEGSVDDFSLDVSGTSDVTMTGPVGNLDADVSGLSDATFDGPIGQVDVDLSGTSTFSMPQAAEVRGDVSGASTLKVGPATNVDVDSSGASSIERD